ncbi:MAG: 5-formyltetrahydrofolate cyclo-ligase [Candidatus Methylomirabilales bacterium]
MEPAGIVAAKADLRRTLLAARQARPRADWERDGQRLAEQALAALPQAARTVTLYVPVGTEPDTRPLLDALRARGIRVILPILLPDNDLDWAIYEGWEALLPARWGLREPAGRRLGVEAVREADLVLVPALAVDRAGHRLGRGGGSYDRVLARADRRRAVAVVYDDEVLDEIPSEPHDRRVGAILTPSGLIHCRA